MVINCVLWSVYGVLIVDWVVLSVNTYGVFKGWEYATTYYALAAAEGKRIETVRLQALLATCFTLVVLGSTAFSRQSAPLGLTASVMSVAMFAAPLSVMLHVIRTGSASALSYTTSLAMMIASGSWTLYGLLVVNNTAVWVPNALGFALALAQQSLIAKYPASKAVVSLDQDARTV